MQLGDITVEVRDKDLNRLGVIRPEDLILDAADEFNNVGIWRVTLASEHPLAAAMSTPGSGIIVTGPEDVLFSGPTVQPKYTASSSNPGGSISFEGITDTTVLNDMLAWPEPSNVDPTTQSLSHDVRTGDAETVAHGYVNANIGPGAPAARRKANLVMGTNGGHGPTITKRARFAVLGSLLDEIASVANLGFRVVQRGSSLVFETFEVVDRSLEVRLDVFSGTLSSQEVAITAPGVTQVIVAGSGELTERQFLAATNAVATAAEAAWGRRIERFVDQRQTTDMAEYQQKADEVLAVDGFTGVAVRLTPMDDTTMRFGREWGLGDRISVVANGAELGATVTGFALLIDADGLRLGATIGDVTAFNRDSAQARRAARTAQRVDQLERT